MTETLTQAPIKGAQQYNAVFKLLKIIDQNNLESDIFKVKQQVNRIYSHNNPGQIQNKDNWTLTGIDDLHNERLNDDNITMETFLDINQSDIMSSNFDASQTILKDFFSIPEIAESQQTSIRVVQKQGDKYIVNIYKIIEVLGQIKLQLKSIAEVEKQMYVNNFRKDNIEYGFVSIITNIPAPFFLFENSTIAAKGENDTFYIEDKFYVAPISKDDALRGLESLVSGAVLKFLLTFFKKRNAIDFSDTLFDRIGIYCHKKVSQLPAAKFKMSSIKISSENELINTNEINILRLPSDTKVFQKNFKSPLNLFSYNLFGYFIDGNFETIESHEIMDIPQAENISVKLNSANNARIRSIRSKLLLPELDKRPSVEYIKEYAEDKYDSNINSLKEHWDKALKVYQRIYKGKEVDQGFFALRFARKYFIPSGRNNYFRNQSDTKPNNEIATFISENYFPYEEFFGPDTVAKYLTSMLSLDIPVYRWAHSRIETMNITLKGRPGGFSSGFNKHNLYPYQCLSRVDYSFYGRTSKKYPELTLIINDSGTKTSWKNKTREFARTLSRNIPTIYILDPQDKFALMLLKKVTKGNSNIIYYSQFADTIKIDAKKRVKSPTATTTFYNQASFSTTSRKITPQRIIPADLDFDNTIFIEYSSSKNVYNFEGKTYTDREFQYERWRLLIQEYHNMDLIVASAPSIKKFEEAHDKKANRLETLYTDKDFIDGFEDAQYNFIFLPEGDMAAKNDFQLAANFIYSNFIEPFRRHTGAKDLKKFIYLVLNSFSPDRQALFHLMQRLSHMPRAGLNSRRHSLTSRIQNVPALASGKNLDKKLFQMLPKPENYDTILRAITSIKRPLNNAEIVGYNSRRFEFEYFIQDYRQLLDDSNNLNLSLEDRSERMNTLIIGYLSKWQTAVELIEKEAT